MANQTDSYQPRIEKIKRVWTSDAKLYVPHEKTEVGFALPSFGPGTYPTVGQDILSNNLHLPSGPHTASLVHVVYCNPPKDDKVGFVDNVKRIMRNNWLWEYEVNYWTSKGLFVIFDKDAKGKNLDIPLSELEKMILVANGAKEIPGSELRFSADKNVRFAPIGSYKLGELTPEELAKDGAIIIRHDFKGAEQLGEVSATFPNKPYVFGLNIKEGQSSELRVSALGGNVVRLHVVGFNWYDDYRSHAFGVF